jgi:hypothetical protein
VNTEAEREQIKVLYSSMKATSELIDVSIFTSPYLFVLKFYSFLYRRWSSILKRKTNF